MKTLKTICPTLVLALVLVAPAYAGDIQTPGSPAPTPTPTRLSTTSVSETTLTEESSTSGDISTNFVEILWALASIF